MEQKLNAYRPSLDQLMGVKRQLINAGLEPHLIPDDWLEAIVAAQNKWLSSTEEGFAHVASLLSFDWCAGDADKEFHVIDDENHCITEVSPDDVLFVRGVLVKRKPIPFSQLEVSEKTKEACDGCGIIGHCTRPIRDPARDRLETFCNHCITYHESPRVSEQGGIEECESCPVTSCSHHPRRRKRYG